MVVGNEFVCIFVSLNPFIMNGISLDDPRVCIDNLGRMVCFHGKYWLGDKHTYNHNDYSGWEEMKNAIIKENDVCVILPLYLYDHSGITMNTTGFSCRWDSGQVGWIYATKKDVREWCGIKKITKPYVDKVNEILLEEVKMYDRYIRGEEDESEE